MHHEDVQNKMWKEIDNAVGVGRLPSLSDSLSVNILMSFDFPFGRLFEVR